MNVSSAVAIVFVNKFAMDASWGCKFVFGEFLVLKMHHHQK